MKSQSESVTVSTKEIAGLVGLQEDRIGQIEKAGKWIKRSGHNQWPLVATLAGLVKFYRSEITKPKPTVGNDDLKKARAREIEIRIEERLHRLTRTEECIAAGDDVVGTVRSEMQSVATRVTRDLALRRQLEDEVDAGLNRASARLRAHGESLRTTGKAAPIR
jgi:hypothetical protein